MPQAGSRRATARSSLGLRVEDDRPRTLASSGKHTETSVTLIVNGQGARRTHGLRDRETDCISRSRPGSISSRRRSAIWVTSRSGRLPCCSRADVVYCEDTRHSRTLFAHFGIKATLRPYHDHSDDEQRERVLGDLAEGKIVALISDAGTPLVSDPGFKLVREAVAAEYDVIAIPGASAVLSARLRSRRCRRTRSSSRASCRRRRRHGAAALRRLQGRARIDRVLRGAVARRCGAC